MVGTLAADAPPPEGKSAQPVGAAEMARAIDRHILARLQEEGLQASPRCDDAEFLRRVYLDLAGVIPTADRARAFLDSPAPDKRQVLIEELLADARYAQHQTDIWQGLLIPKLSDNRRIATEPFTEWLRNSFQENKPWNRLVTELLTASGSPADNGATVYWLANATPDKVTDSVSRLFLGIQLQCAQCHDHPFTGWKQTEYWGLAQFFMKVRFEGNARRDGTASVSESDRGRRSMLPEGVKQVPPQFFQGPQPNLARSEPYRPVFAQWLTSPDNPYFGPATVNRVWSQFFGHGLVDPVDDMHPGNPPSHPELLRELSLWFVSTGYDLKALIRAICLSETYQRTSKPAGNNEGDTQWFSHMAIRPLTPEQLFDSLQQVIGQADANRGGGRAAANAAREGSARAQFVAFFASEEGADPTEYQAGIPQVLRLMNAPQLNRGGALVEEAWRRHKDPKDRIEHLFLGTLSRRPRPEELQRFLQHLQQNRDNERAALADILWVLLNTGEFAMNH
jgi:hypothetical protein